MYYHKLSFCARNCTMFLIAFTRNTIYKQFVYLPALTNFSFNFQNKKKKNMLVLSR